MVRVFAKMFMAGLVLLLTTGCAEKINLAGKADFLGIGAGPKPAQTNRNVIVDDRHMYAQVCYTPELKVTEQDAGETTKFVLGDALVKEFSGKPDFLVQYLNEYQDIDNWLMILDKDGVVAWSSAIVDKNGALAEKEGVVGKGLTGTKRMPFEEAVEKFVVKQETTKYKPDQEIFEKSSIFGGYKGAQVVNQKIPDMEVTDANGNKVLLSSITENGKPTILMLFMSSAREDMNMGDVLSAGANLVNMFSGRSMNEGPPTPDTAISMVEDAYFKK